MITVMDFKNNFVVIRTLTKLDNKLCHKLSLNSKEQIIEIIFSESNIIKTEIHNKYK